MTSKSQPRIYTPCPVLAKKTPPRHLLGKSEGRDHDLVYLKPGSRRAPSETARPTPSWCRAMRPRSGLGEQRGMPGARRETRSRGRGPATPCQHDALTALSEPSTDPRGSAAGFCPPRSWMASELTRFARRPPKVADVQQDQDKIYRPFLFDLDMVLYVLGRAGIVDLQSLGGPWGRGTLPEGEDCRGTPRTAQTPDVDEGRQDQK